MGSLEKGVPVLVPSPLLLGGRTPNKIRSSVLGSKTGIIMGGQFWFSVSMYTSEYSQKKIPKIYHCEQQCSQGLNKIGIFLAFNYN